MIDMKIFIKHIVQSFIDKYVSNKSQNMDILRLYVFCKIKIIFRYYFCKDILIFT